MGLENIKFHYDKLIIGSTLNSILYAFSYNIPIIFTQNIQVQNNIPFHFEFFDKDEDLSYFTVRSLEQCHNFYTLFTHEEIKFGIQKQKLYNQLCISMSLAGLIPFIDKITNIKLEDNILTLIIKEKETVNIKADKILIFDINEIKNIPEPYIKEKEKYIVVDWFDVRYGMKHKYDYYISQNDFINQIFFYRTKRTNGMYTFKEVILKDVLSISYLNKEQIEDINYSDIFASLKVKDIMARGGITGSVVGGKDSVGMLRPVKLKPTLRNIRRINYDYYKNYDNIYFMNQYSEKEIIELCKNNTEKTYVKKLNNSLFYFKHRYQEVF